jgi:Caspase domain
MRVVLGLLAGLALWLAAASDARAERRVALVIGNSAYQNASQLPNPVNDATAIAGLLRGADFDVVELQSNLGVSDLRRAVRNFSQTAQNADIAVVYFAGHGIEVDGANYLVPVDAKLERDIDVDDESLSLERILKVIEPARRLRLVILDACRDNPFARTMKRTVASRAIGRGLARVEPDTANTLIAFAARAGSTASDGTDGNSPFTSALLKHLTKAGLDLRIAFGLIHDEVMNSTGNKQEPFVYGSLGGAFVSLVPEAPKAEPPAEPGQRLTPNADVRADYEIAERVGTVDAWAYFLAVHPSGYYANLAREQLAKLGGGARPRPQPAAAPIPDAPRPTIALAPPAGPIQPAPKPNIASVLGPAELASLLQTDLKRVGCDPGPSNGQWNGRSRRALENFNKMPARRSM